VYKHDFVITLFCKHAKRADIHNSDGYGENKPTSLKTLFSAEGDLAESW